MKELIISELKKIEKEEQVKILFAVESGSRAWGFPSKDSDYDVRFVYIHPVEWYLSIDEKRDVIEYSINKLLDFSGWDIRKALTLFKKSNPPIMEWLSSPIIYMNQFSFIEQLRDIRDYYFSPKASIYHYLHMATGNYRDYLLGSDVRVKKYFYVLRPILACKWLEKNNSAPPVEFIKLLETQIDDQDLYHEIRKLLDRKLSGEELDFEPRIAIINSFLDEQIKYFEEYVKNVSNKKTYSNDILDELFRITLKNIVLE